VSVVRGYLESLRDLRRNGHEKNVRSDEENSTDKAVDKPTSIT
jgi:hypothetical protein